MIDLGYREYNGSVYERPRFALRNWQVKVRDAINAGKKRLIFVICRRGG